MGRRRRRFLTATGIAGLAGLAGCSGLLTEDGTSDDASQQDTSDPDTEDTSDPDLASQQGKLVPDDIDYKDYFGDSVALAADGSTALIGAAGADGPSAERAGSAYVFTRSESGWSRQAKLVADDGDRSDGFGHSVGLSGDGSTALIGADDAEDPNGSDAGSAYVFTRTGGSWSQGAKLTADDGDPDDEFGSSVALADDGSTALIGADNDEDPNGSEAGSAYVFTRSEGGWSQGAKLVPDDGDSEDAFGRNLTLAADGSTALIAAPADEDRAGSVYVFTRSESDWSQQAKITADDGNSGDVFGGSVALTDDGSNALIGAWDDEDPNGERVGSAYVFTRSGGIWSQGAKLAPDDTDRGDEFGYSVGLSGDGSTALIGAHYYDEPHLQVGSAYVFVSGESSWSQRAKLAPDDGEMGDHFGEAVTLAGDGSTALIGAPDDDLNEARSGSAYVFERPWQETG